MQFKKYISQFLLSVIALVFLTPLDTFAGTLTNFSHTADTWTSGEEAIHTFTFTTETDVPSNGSILIETIGLDFYNYININNSTVKVNGGANIVSSFQWPSQTSLKLNISTLIPAWSTVVVVLAGEQGFNKSVGEYSFTSFLTQGLSIIDSINPPNFSITGITNVAASSPYSTATVTWETSDARTSQVEYGLTDSYGSSTTVTTLDTHNHEVSISNLSQLTTYHYRVVSALSGGGTARSSDRTFTTGSNPGGGIASFLTPEGELPTPPAASPEETAIEVTPTSQEIIPSVEVTPTNTEVIPTESINPVSEEIMEDLHFSGFIHINLENDSSDVSKLQKFLNKFEGEKLDVDGVYKETDLNAVKRFQVKYADFILAPWGITTPTGYVYKTTLKMIHSIIDA